MLYAHQEEDVGAWDITLTVSDGDGGEAIVAFTLEVESGHRPSAFPLLDGCTGSSESSGCDGCDGGCGGLCFWLFFGTAAVPAWSLRRRQDPPA